MASICNSTYSTRIFCANSTSAYNYATISKIKREKYTHTGKLLFLIVRSWARIFHCRMPERHILHWRQARSKRSGEN